MKITANDGTEFGKENMNLAELKGAVEKCNAHEASLALKNLQKKKKEQNLLKQKAFEEITDCTYELNTLISNYTSLYGGYFEIRLDHGKVIVANEDALLSSVIEMLKLK
jgi:type I site-specific restriction endonuclease